jgi:hypothetical protein
MRCKADIGEMNIAAKQVTLNRGRPMAPASETSWPVSRADRTAIPSSCKEPNAVKGISYAGVPLEWTDRRSGGMPIV